MYNDAGVDGGDERREQIEGGEERVGPDGGVASGEAREDRGGQEAAQAPRLGARVREALKGFGGKYEGGCI